jgi:D-cysteine desulfhydrase
MSDCLSAAFPRIGANLARVSLADLPTPVSTHTLRLPSRELAVSVKHDDVSNVVYGGNKVRKLEYLLQRAIDRNKSRIATFGAAGSNHALATAIHATGLGLDCTCFLSQQKPVPSVARTLNMHRRLGTEIVRWGRAGDRLALLRGHLQHRNAWVIPLGGTCWLGTVGFVNAGLELAAQVSDGELPRPARIYVAAGTTGSVAGLALGLASAGLDTEIHAIRVADEPYGGPDMMRRIAHKTALMLGRIDPAFVSADEALARVRWRDEFLAGGYARVDEATLHAVALASDRFGLKLETTYTGKAMAALAHDAQQSECDGKDVLFWNTYNSIELPVDATRPESLDNIPAAFEHYYDEGPGRS